MVSNRMQFSHSRIKSHVFWNFLCVQLESSRVRNRSLKMISTYILQNQHPRTKSIQYIYKKHTRKQGKTKIKTKQNKNKINSTHKPRLPLRYKEERRKHPPKITIASREANVRFLLICSAYCDSIMLFFLFEKEKQKQLLLLILLFISH